MKLRCTHNSIRLRVRKSDLDTFQQQGAINESILFSNQVALVFTLKLDVASEELNAQLIDNEVIVTISEAIAKKWINTNEIGIEHTTELGGGETLHILIEKDFPCLDRENEDKLDTFWELAKDKQPDNC